MHGIVVSTVQSKSQVQLSRVENGAIPEHSTLHIVRLNYITTHSQTPIFCIVSRLDKRYLYHKHAVQKHLLGLDAMNVVSFLSVLI